MTTLAATLFAAAGMAQAQDAQALAKDAGCLKCHSVSGKKTGPSLKQISADYKKAGLSGDKAVEKMKKAHEADDLKGVKSDADLKTILAWVMTQ
jgi:cytochrome c551/c552